MSHEVEIDAQRLDAAFASFESQQQALPPGQEYIAQVEEPQPPAWLTTCVFAFEWLNAYAPNWGVPSEKVYELAEKAALMMDQWFPSGPGDPEKLPPWAQFLVTLGGIVVFYGFDFDTMTLKPLKEPEPEPEPEEETQASDTDRQEPTKHATGGKFSTMGASND